MIRVLHVFGGLDPGGAESRTMDIYRELDKNKIQFDFLVHTNKVGVYEDEIKKLGGKIYRVPNFTVKTALAYKKAVKDFFESHNYYKAVHGHMLSTAFIYQKEAKKNNIPIRIAHSRNGTRKQWSIVNLIKWFTEKSSRFYVTDMFAVSKLAGYSKFGKKKVERQEVKIIPNSIKSKKFTFDKRKREYFRDEFNFNEKNIIGHVGRFHAQKNHIFLIEIFYEMLINDPNSLLVLIGEGTLEEEINKKITELNIEESVLLLGRRSDIPNILQTFDILIFPSTHEGFPGVVLEAQASGLPCLISDSITQEVRVTDLVQTSSLNRDAKHWANLALKILKEKNRKNTYKQIVSAGYDIETTARWYENFYLNWDCNIKRNT